MQKVLTDGFRLKHCAKFNLELLNRKDYPILKKRGIGPNVFKFASMAIIDCMKDPYYCFSYPSYQYLADQVLVGKTSISDHIHLVENSGLFLVTKLSAKGCKQFVWERYDQRISPNYPRGPVVYEINFDSPFWRTLKTKIDSGKKGTRLKVPRDVITAMLARTFGASKVSATYPRGEAAALEKQGKAILRVS